MHACAAPRSAAICSLVTHEPPPSRVTPSLHHDARRHACVDGTRSTSPLAYLYEYIHMATQSLTQIPDPILTRLTSTRLRKCGEIVAVPLEKVRFSAWDMRRRYSTLLRKRRYPWRKCAAAQRLRVFNFTCPCFPVVLSTREAGCCGFGSDDLRRKRRLSGSHRQVCALARAVVGPLRG